MPVVHIPTREEGYGLHIDKVEDLAKQGVDLITFPSTAVPPTSRRWPPNLGVDVIVVDHHEMGDEVPRRWQS